MEYSQTASASLPYDPAVVRARVLEIVVRCLDRAPSTVRMDSSLWGELEAESLDMLDIVYSLERAFVIRLPRVNLLQRANDVFGENTMLVEGIVTPLGLKVIQRSMPEIPSEMVKPNMRIQEFRQLITVESFARIVLRCLEAKAALRCGRCGGPPEQVPGSPMELRCVECEAPIDLPSGEDMLVSELYQIGRELNLTPAVAEEPVVSTK